MLDNNSKIAKMLGRDKEPIQGFGITGFNKFPNVGMGQKPKITHAKVINEIQLLLDKLSDVKKAHGELSIEFSDGTKGKFKILYK